MSRRTSIDPATLPSQMAGYFRRHLSAYLYGAAALGAFQLSMNRIDWLSRSAIDRIFGAAPRTALTPVLFMLGLALVAFATRIVSRLSMFNAGRDVEYELRTRLLHHLHKLGTAFYRRMSSGEIMSRATSDLGQIRMLFGFGVMNLINVAFAFTSGIQVMLAVSPRLTAASLIPLPIVVLLTRTYSGHLFRRMRGNQEALGRLSEVVQSNISGVRVIRSFALEVPEAARFDAINEEYLEASLGLARLRGSMQPILGSASALGMMVVFWYGATLLQRGPAAGGISRGDFFAFQLALGRLTWPMIGLGLSLATVQRGRASFYRLKEIFDTAPEIVDGTTVPTDSPDPTDQAGALRVDRLSFKQGDRQILDQVSFELPRGGSLAIVGRTGSGKSTLALLLARLLPTPRGAVFLDGRDVCDLPLSTLRRTIGYAQQEPLLFSTTLTRNVGFALDEPEGEIDRVVAAARDAQLYDEALSLPDGLDTVVGERGVQLSGGQKQRAALARALISEPRILILDDPMSAVDARTEAAILEAIAQQLRRRAVVLITHRVAAASRCDRILVLEGGRVIDSGTHVELVARGGLYAAFAEEQALAAELDRLDPAAEEVA
jgi:ATP-binding cassette subfamily B protein